MTIASGSVGYLTFEQLTNPPTIDEAFQSIITLMTASGIAQIDDVNPGTFLYDITQLNAFTFVGGLNRAAALAQGIMTPTAQGDWLTATAYSFFNNQRSSAVQVQGMLNVALGPGQNPVNILPGQLTVTFGQTYQYTNVSSFVLNGLTPNANILFKAVLPGAGQDYNVPTNAQADLWSVSPPTFNGLVISNPPVAGTLSWVIVHGQDEQTDDSLRNQCQSQWGTLGTQGPAPLRLQNAIISASNGVISEVFVDLSQPNGPFTTTAYCATVDDVASPGDISAITGTIQQMTYNGASLIFLLPAIPIQFGSSGQNTAIQVYYNPALNTSVVSASVTQAAQKWIESIPLGGIDNSPLTFNGSSQFADISSFEDALYNCGNGDVVRNVVIQNRSHIGLSPKQKLQQPAFGWFSPALQLTASRR